MELNKEKCKRWRESFIEILRLTKELSDEESEYIKAKFSIAFGQLTLEKLKKGENYNDY